MTKQFWVRQKFQLAQLEEQRERLKQLESKLEERSRNAEKIIEQRVKEMSPESAVKSKLKAATIEIDPENNLITLRGTKESVESTAKLLSQIIERKGSEQKAVSDSGQEPNESRKRRSPKGNSAGHSVDVPCPQGTQCVAKVD